MPTIPQRPSFNDKVVKTMTFDQLVELYPLADPDYLRSEWERINPKQPDAPIHIGLANVKPNP